MKYYYDKIAELIKDHSFLMAALAISISLIGGAYGLGMKLGENREVFLEDKVTSLGEKMETLNEEKNDLEEAKQLAQSQLAGLREQLSEYQKDATAQHDTLEKITADQQQKELTINGMREELAGANVKLSSLINDNKRLTDALSDTQRKLDDMTAKQGKVEDESARMAAGDVVALLTGDTNWIKYFKLKDMSVAYGFGFQTDDGRTYTKKGEKIFVNVKGKDEEARLDYPAISLGDKTICYSFLSVVSDEFIKEKKVCRVNFLADSTLIR